LKIWKAENKALTLIARLSTPNGAERRQAEDQLMQLAREMIELDVQVLELKAEQLERELGQVKEELGKTRDNVEDLSKERYRNLLLKVKRSKP
jgi:hypothetical protein